MLWTTLRKMQSDDSKARIKGAQALAQYNDPKALAALVEALGDEDVEVRRAAAASLANHGEPAVDALVHALWDRKSFVQFEASQSLTRIGPAAIPKIAEGLSSSDAGVRDTATQLLQQISEAIASNPDVIKATTEAMQAMALRAQAESERVHFAEEPEGTDHAEDQNPSPDSAEEPSPDEAGLSELQRLSRDLIAGSPQVRRAAAAALCDSADSKYWEELVANSPRRDAKIEHLATSALAKLCRLGDVRPMRWEVAHKVIERLADVEGEHAVAVLRHGLGHIHPSVRSASLQALETRGDPPADHNERRLRAELARQDWDALKKLGAGNVPALMIAQLQSSDRRNRADAARTLGQLGDPIAVDALIGALKKRDEDVRSAAAEALGKLNDPRAVDALVHRLRDRSADVKAAACAALAELKSPDAIIPIGKLLKSVNKSMRRSAVRALAQIGTEASVEPLGRALGDGDEDIRRTAAEALATIATPEAQELLAAATHDEDQHVRATAARGLGSTHPTSGETGNSKLDALTALLRDGDRSSRHQAAKSLEALGWEPTTDEERALVLVANENPLEAEKLGEAAIDALLLALLDGGHYYLSETAAQVLGRLLDIRAVRPLCKALTESDDLTLRAAAATALGRIRDFSSLPIVLKAHATEVEAFVKERISEALVKLKDTSEPDRLVAALQDDEPKARLRAAVLLARRGDPRGIQWMEQAIHGDDTMLRGQAMSALCAVGGPAVIKILINRVTGKGFDGPTEAVAALVQIGEPALPAILEALPAMEHNPRWAMLMGLAKMGQPAMAAMTAMLPTAPKELKKSACEVLGRMDDRDDVPHKPVEPMIALLEDEDADVRRYAVHGLGLLKWKPDGDKQRQSWEKAKR